MEPDRNERHENERDEEKRDEEQEGGGEGINSLEQCFMAIP